MLPSPVTAPVDHPGIAHAPRVTDATAAHSSDMRTDVYPAIPGAAIGWLTSAQMVDVDRLMIDELRIGLLQMLENAGRNLARLVIDLAAPGRVATVCGPGGNGGGGMVAARHLANAGVDVVVTTSRPGAELSGVPARQHDILRRMGVGTSRNVVAADVTIDALLGYSLRGAPRGRVADLIAQQAGASVVALDTPSGPGRHIGKRTRVGGRSRGDDDARTAQDRAARSAAGRHAQPRRHLRAPVGHGAVRAVRARLLAVVDRPCDVGVERWDHCVNDRHEHSVVIVHHASYWGVASSPATRAENG